MAPIEEPGGEEIANGAQGSEQDPDRRQRGCGEPPRGRLIGEHLASFDGREHQRRQPQARDQHQRAGVQGSLEPDASAYRGQSAGDGGR